ncbi:hypothetical protein CsSME_00034570 [Camellia sinensis var. sinensis]
MVIKNGASNRKGGGDVVVVKIGDGESGLTTIKCRLITMDCRSTIVVVDPCTTMEMIGEQWQNQWLWNVDWRRYR